MGTIVVEEGETGLRLDRVLCVRLSLSRTAVRRLIDADRVRLNGRRARKGELVRAGDRLEVESESEAEGAVPDGGVVVRVYYEDADVIVADKPAGMPTHPLRAGERSCLANGLIARYPEMAHVGYEPRQPGLVNRLDNDTSGLVIAARNAPAFERLRAQLAAGDIAKRYLALVTTELAPRVIDLALQPRDQGARVQGVAPGQAGGRAARTEIMSCRPFGVGTYLLELAASPAYRHQVRVHLAAIGAPIVGDALYGGAAGARHYLHAASVAFARPSDAAMVRVESPLPDDWPRNWRG